MVAGLLVSCVCSDTFTAPVYRHDVGKGAVPMIKLRGLPHVIHSYYAAAL